MVFTVEIPASSREEAYEMAQRAFNTAPLAVREVDSKLSPTQERVANLITLGFTNKDIAADLQITERTVKSHMSQIFRKLGVDNRVRLARKLMQKGNSAPQIPDRLTTKEHQIATMRTMGMPYKDIASKLGTSEQYCRNLMRLVYDKLGVSNAQELVVQAYNKAVEDRLQ